MGPKNSQIHKGQQSEVVVNHPHFSKAKVLKEKDEAYLQTSTPVVNQKEIKEW